MEDMSTLAQQLLQVFCHISARNIDTLYAVRHDKAFVDGHGMRHTVARVEDDTCCPTAGVQGEHGLDGCVDGGDVESFEEDLGGGIAVLAGIEWWFGEQHR